MAPHAVGHIHRVQVEQAHGVVQAHAAKDLHAAAAQVALHHLAAHHARKIVILYEKTAVPGGLRFLQHVGGIQLTGGHGGARVYMDVDDALPKVFSCP